MGHGAIAFIRSDMRDWPSSLKNSDIESPHPWQIPFGICTPRATALAHQLQLDKCNRAALHGLLTQVARQQPPVCPAVTCVDGSNEARPSAPLDPASMPGAPATCTTDVG